MGQTIKVTVRGNQKVIKAYVSKEGLTKTELDGLNVAYNDTDNNFSAKQTVVGLKSVENSSSKFFASNGEVEAMTENSTSSVTFSKHNTWVNSQQTPITGAITYSLTNAINGAVSCVYYKAATLVITDTSNRVVIQNDNSFISNELCLVWFTYDEGSGAIHVNVVNGDTGNRPHPIGYDYGIELLAASANAVTIPMPINANSHIKIKVREFNSIVNAKYLFSNQLSTSTNGSVVIQTKSTAGLINAVTRDSSTTQTINSFSTANGSVLELIFTGGTNVEYLVNGVSKGSDTLVSFDLTPANDLIIGAFNSAGALGVDIVIDSFEIDGEVFDCNEGSGTTVTGNLGTVCQLINTPNWV